MHVLDLIFILPGDVTQEMKLWTSQLETMGD